MMYHEYATTEMHEDADHKQALCLIPVLDYGKEVKLYSYHMIVKYLYSYQGST